MNKKGIIIIVIMAVIILAGCVGVFWYGSQLGPVNEKEKKESTIEIESGMTTEKILNLLHKEGLIKRRYGSDENFCDSIGNTNRIISSA